MDLIPTLLQNQHTFFIELGQSAHPGFIALRLLAILLCGGGLFGLVMGAGRDPRQLAASGIKVPLLFVLTLAVCFPLLSVVAMLLGIAVAPLKLLAMILFALALAALLMAACAPIALFFVLTGSGYHFMKLLHVGIFALAGGWGVLALWLHVVRGSALPGISGWSGGILLLIWLALFAFVGAQMAWTLRPFMGGSGLPFALLRRREPGMNFYTALIVSLAAINKNERPNTINDTTTQAHNPCTGET